VCGITWMQLFKREEKVMQKKDMVKIALDLAQVLMAAGDELETIMGSPETEELVKSIEQLIADIEAEA